MFQINNNYLTLAVLFLASGCHSATSAASRSQPREEPILVRESGSALKCSGVNRSELLAPQSQIFAVKFQFDTQAQLNISPEVLAKKNDSKQSQEFDIVQTAATTLTEDITSPVPVESTTSTPLSTTTSTTLVTQEPASSSSTSPVEELETSSPLPSGEQPPIASLTTRKGDAVFCGEANPNGNSNKNVISRIIGGSKTLPGEFPFQVRLNIRSRRGSGICGGVILNERYILTAAHCMTACVSSYLNTATIETSGIHATIGDHSIKSNDGELDINVEKIIPHEKYDACNFYSNNHDISLIKTAEPIEYRFTSDGYGSINRPCMPADKDVVYRDGELAVVSGWGVMRDGSGSLSNILRYVQVPVVNVTKCQETYGSRVTDNHVCAGFQAGGKDSCQGDSGGPLVRVVKNRYELVGIVSFGYGCGQPSAPGVYTRVASYLDWIKANM